MIYQITEYKLVENYDSYETQDEVQDLISKGFQPQGDLIVVNDKNKNLNYIQKMVKYAQ